MDELMMTVGLSPRLKDRVDRKTASIADGGSVSVAPGAKPFEPQSLKTRRNTERKALESYAVSYLMSPSSDLDQLEKRNQGKRGNGLNLIKTAEP